MRKATRCSSIAGAALCSVGSARARPPSARADVGGYLLNVTVRPGYNFANADQALSYGYGICDKIRQGRDIRNSAAGYRPTG